MINICLCDDEKNILNYYSEKINEIAKLNNKLIKIEMFESGESLLFELEENPNRFDIIIIDIIMKNVNGIDATKILRNYGYKGIIIFLTSSSEFALDAFEVEPLNYIMKNEDQENKFKEIFLKAIRQVEYDISKKIVIHNKQKNIIVKLDNIIYIESINKKIIIYRLYEEPEEVYYRLNEILKKIEPFGFIRCHKSYIVNSKYVVSFNNLQCKLLNESIIPIGRKFSKDFKNKFLNYEFENLLL